jgi:peptidoglycan-associated lipoprotein
MNIKAAQTSGGTITVMIAKYTLMVLMILPLMMCLSACSSSGSGKDFDSSGSALTDEELSLGQDARFGSGNIPTAASRESGPFSDVHFAYDSSVVDTRYHKMLQDSAQQLVKDPTLKAEIEGHCDKRGTHEYNLALGQERAKAVFKILQQYGVSKNQMSTISYGAEIPLDPAENEAAYAKNRRVHFAIYREKR